ncbi:RHS repeat-associated core domain-containing protein [Chryseobacterium sp. C-71]|uniref:DUF6443 domain-containing protein n=1 Tax=Chryseobacterium sp. C-71 TaxID=2893882 RepID=UPI001E3F7032|nr:DUF6443 domain-containing protein [Chryseobacterium sp. C-71]UFH33305.1 RHS repeat-associated core domain-containing protein [Chryseobacterium sp. C-71]
MKKIIILVLLFAVNLILAQTLTTSENYVYTKVYLSPDGSKKSETVQYFDGLGRPKQVVQVKATPLGQDLVVPITYDPLGRQTKTLLPIPVSTANSGIQAVDENSVNSYYGVANAYSEQKLEASPLGRVLEVAHPGAAWAMSSGHTTKMQYLTNIEGDQVKRFNTTASWSNGVLTTSITNVTFYAPNQLSKNKVTDEDGNITIDFKNSEGKTVLLRKESSAGKLDTYYIYNNYSQLAFVISPKGNEKITTNGNVVTSQILNDLCYQYVYDNRFRQVEKKLPGKGWEYMVYDQQNRMVASQDANMKNNTANPNRWMFTRYDKFGRVLYTGVFTGGTRAQEQTNANAKGLNNETRSTESFTLNGQEIFYTNTAYPSAAFIPYSVNYYDTYPGTPSVPQNILGVQTLSSFVNLTVNNVSSIRNLKSMPTASLVKNLDDDAWSSTHIWYDQLGRAIGSQGKNHLGGYTKTEKELDFSGAVLSANTFHKRSNADAEVVINERFVYDNNFRLKQHYHKVNSNTEELLADYTYNELGQVTNKKVGNNLQSIDYTYNIRGWMTKVNDPANLGGKLFGYELKFDAISNPSVAQANYNGNITEATWKNAEDGVLKKYSYQYDPYNRLTAALYQEPESTLPQAGFYNETMNYDANGNISNLKRNEKDSGLLQEIDDLEYAYNGNRLTSVVDHKNNYSGYPDTSGNMINYDLNGNMTDHVDKGILEIKYNDLNLPSYIKFNEQYFTRGFWDNVNIKYFYNAAGTKLRKEHRYSETSIYRKKTTDYLDGFQYEEIQNISPYTLKFFATSEGYFDFTNNRYIYHYNDHLGNVRLSFTRQGSAAIIVEKNDYYAFGLKHGGSVIDQSGVGYNYEYNGKELQAETGMYDYGARFYMPDLGRWGVVDPLAEIYTRHSPYNYAVNNPTRFTDPDGRGVIDVNGDGSHMVYDGQDAIDMFNSFNNSSSFTFPSYSYSYIDAGGSSGGGGGGSSLSSWMQNNIGNSFGPGDPFRKYLQQTTNSYFGAIESIDQYQLDHANWTDEYQGTMEFLGKLKEYFDSVGDKMGGAGYGTFAIDNLKTIKETVEKFKNFNPSLASVVGAITGVIGTSVNMEGDRFSQLMDIYKNADYRYDQLHKRNPMLDKGVTVNVNVVIGKNGGGGYTDIKIYDISTHRYLSGGKIIHRNYK